MDITQTGGLTVDVILTVTGAIVAAGDHDLVGIVGQRPIGVVQRQGSFRETNGATLLSTAEDHVLHLGAAEGLGALLAHDPQDRIGNIRFTGAVGTDNGSDVIAKANQSLVRERLESLYFQ